MTGEAPGPAMPGDDEVVVHVWRTDVAPTAGARDTLSDEERARAGRFVHARDRDRFVASHVGLRAVLGAVTAREPGSLAFARAPNGKPSLAPMAGTDPSPHFSLSHSGDLAALAVARFPVGLDLERERAPAPFEIVALLAPAERTALDAVHPDGRGRALFGLWVRKEALLKATGRGLADPLDGFAMSVPPAPARLDRMDDDPCEAARWLVVDVAAAPGYAAAVAARRTGWRLVPRWTAREATT